MDSSIKISIKQENVKDFNVKEDFNVVAEKKSFWRMFRNLFYGGSVECTLNNKKYLIQKKRLTFMIKKNTNLNDSKECERIQKLVDAIQNANQNSNSR